MNQLATRFKRINRIQAATPLSDDDIAPVVPSIYAENPHASRSVRYAYIPTSQVLTKLRDEGFQPVMACQARVRNVSKQGFAKHMLRLRHADHLASNEAANEIVLINSHDGTSAYQMLAGSFRFVCHNGLVCGHAFEDIRVQHRGTVVDDVVAGAYRVLADFERIDEVRSDMKALALSSDEQRAFAGSALQLRFTGDEVPIAEDAVLRPRRYADQGSDLWTTLNVVQEYLVKGGLRYVKGRKRVTTRAIRGIDGNVSLQSCVVDIGRGHAGPEGGGVTAFLTLTQPGHPFPGWGRVVPVFPEIGGRTMTIYINNDARRWFAESTSGKWIQAYGALYVEGGYSFLGIAPRCCSIQRRRPSTSTVCDRGGCVLSSTLNAPMSAFRRRRRPRQQQLADFCVCIVF